MLNWFWSGFWPNLAATFAGIILGVPIALWLNRHMGGVAERNLRADESERLKNRLEVIRATLTHNRQKLLYLDQVLQQDSATFDVGLDLVAWEACRDEIIPFLKNPDLRRRIALYFGRLATVARLSALYLDQAVGVVSALGGVATTRTALKNHLLAFCQQLLTESEQLRTEIERVESAMHP